MSWIQHFFSSLEALLLGMSAFQERLAFMEISWSHREKQAHLIILNAKAITAG